MFFGGDFKRSIMQHPALPPVAFHDSVAGWSRRSRVYPQYAHPALRKSRFARSERRVHRCNFTANASPSPLLCTRYIRGHAPLCVTLVTANTFHVDVTCMTFYDD